MRAAWAAKAAFVAATAGLACTQALGLDDLKDRTDASVDAASETRDAGVDHTALDEGTEAGVGGDEACTSGATCAPADCHLGVTLCDAGATVCSPSGTSPNGSACDAGAVCSSGSCVACAAGTDCTEAGSCQKMAIACATGTPTCMPAGNQPNGMACGVDRYCDEGTCAPCKSGAPCEPPNQPCHLGIATCVDGGVGCADLGTNAPDGTSCGTNMVCRAGSCVACTAGATCTAPGNPCQMGTSSCTTGSSVCTALSNVTNGTPCGTNEVCGGGQCNACTINAGCHPNDEACLLGVIACGSGAPTCTQTGNAANGTACGTNEVCDEGNCGPCVAGAACHPGGNPCVNGTTSCVSGLPTCTPSADAPNGTACGTNEVCDDGVCATCTANAPCNPGGNPCLAGTISCATGQPTCTGTGNVPNGMSCGSGSVCCGGACDGVQTDVHNCGSCGHDCMGSPCVGGVCQPVDAGQTG